MNRRKFLKFAFLSGAASLVASYPVFIERNIITINRYVIPLDNLPASFNGFTIAQLTDLHYGFLVSQSFITKIVEKTNKLQTDLIVCTGDYVHKRNTENEIEIVWPLLAKLRARHGVYSVLGNHDHKANEERSLFWLHKTGQSVRHTCKPVTRGKDRIYIGGAGDYWQDELKIDQAFARSEENSCRILLSHNPDSIDTNYKTNLSLVISGHTHGGQVIVPFFGPPVLPVKNKKYSSGLISTPKSPLFISRGLGWAIYPVRFNCFPEIAVLELRSTKTNA